jgi:hypothetical protein
MEIILTTSSLALLGGLMIVFLVPNGPGNKAKALICLLFGVFENQNLRSAAFGYFGHMWELYAFGHLHR